MCLDLHFPSRFWSLSNTVRIDVDGSSFRKMEVRRDQISENGDNDDYDDFLKQHLGLENEEHHYNYPLVLNLFPSLL